MNLRNLDRSKFCLHGFTFDSEDERQVAANTHLLWPDFVAYWKRRYDGEPLMKDERTRELYEFFIHGGFCEMNRP